MQQESPSVTKFSATGIYYIIPVTDSKFVRLILVKGKLVDAGDYLHIHVMGKGDLLQFLKTAWNRFLYGIDY